MTRFFKWAANGCIAISLLNVTTRLSPGPAGAVEFDAKIWCAQLLPERQALFHALVQECGGAAGVQHVSVRVDSASPGERGGHAARIRWVSRSVSASHDKAIFGLLPGGKEMTDNKSALKREIEQSTMLSSHMKKTELRRRRKEGAAR